MWWFCCTSDWIPISINSSPLEVTFQHSTAASTLNPKVKKGGQVLTGVWLSSHKSKLGMAFAGPESNLTAGLINMTFVAQSNCFRTCWNPQILRWFLFFMLWILQYTNASYCQNFLQNFHRSLCHQSRFSLGGFPRSVVSSFLRFQAKKKWLRAEAWWLTATGSAAVAKGKVWFGSRVTLHSKALHFHWVTAVSFPVLFSRARTSQRGCYCKHHHLSPAELHFPGSLETSFPSHTLCLQTCLPSSAFTDAGLTFLAHFCWHTTSTSCAAPEIPGYTQTYTFIRKKKRSLLPSVAQSHLDIDRLQTRKYFSKRK